MLTRSFIYICILFIVSANDCLGQLPSSELYEITFSRVDADLNIKKVRYLNGFNLDGYNNHPIFIGLDKLYISTNMYADEETDIVQLDLAKQEILRLTDTEASEFSPTPHPDGEHISTIRLESDGQQNLWAYPKDRSSYGYQLLPNINDIGYHHWLSEDEVVLFRLPEPFTLSLANVETNTNKIIIDNIGRCLKTAPNGSFYFVHKLTPDVWTIKSYDPDDGTLTTITQTLSGSEDFDVFRDGSLIMGKGSKLYYFHPDRSTDWEMMADLTDYGVTDITRITNSYNKIILVNRNKK